MTDEVELWRKRIIERKTKGQTIVDWCSEHNVTKGTYHYWRKQVKRADGIIDNHAENTQPITFVKVKTPGAVKSALQVTWQDVSIRLSSSQEAHLAAEMIACLRNLC